MKNQIGLLLIFALGLAGCASPGYVSRKAFEYCSAGCSAKESDPGKCEDICYQQKPKQAGKGTDWNKLVSGFAEGFAIGASANSSSVSNAGSAPQSASKQTDYVCFNSCTSQGHQWEFCHAKCDY